MYILVLYVFNRNFDKCLQLFKSYDRLLNVMDLSDIGYYHLSVFGLLHLIHIS